MQEKEVIEICKKEFVNKFKLSSNELQQRDFEFLHEKIMEQTKVSISTATLRRFWSNNYQNTPQINTLNALAECLGYKNWHEYKIHCNISSVRKFRVSKKYGWVLFLIAVILLIWSLIPLTNNHKAHMEAESKVHMGIPATIGFHYNIEGLDNAEIQLSWNPYERTKLDPENDFYTGTYFYPDYHEATIIVDDQVMASDYVHITTEGWHGLIMQKGYDVDPTFLSDQEFNNKGNMAVTDSTAIKSGLDVKEFYPVFTLSNTNLDSISGDAFSMSCKLQLFQSEAKSNCRSIDILIKGETGNIRIPISQTGCYGLYNLAISDVVLTGKTNDLSNLSSDLSKPSVIQITSSNNEVKIKVDKNSEYIGNYKKPIGKVKVVKFVLTGAGSVTDFEILKSN